jgi:cell division septation protein DedD
MSRVYEALKRVEADREVARARETAGLAVPRTSSPGFWWRGVLLGFAMGLGVAAIAIPLLLEPERGASPSETSAPARQVVSPLRAVVPRAAFVEASLPPATQAREEDRAHEDVPIATTTLANGGEPSVDGVIPIAAAPRAQAEPEPVGPDTEPAPVRVAGTFWIQVGIFQDHDNATRLVTRLTDKRYPAMIIPGRSARGFWMVRVGTYPDRSAAEITRAALQREDFSGFVVTDSGR